MKQNMKQNMKQKYSKIHIGRYFYIHEAFNCAIYARSQTLYGECASLDKAECI